MCDSLLRAGYEASVGVFLPALTKLGIEGTPHPYYSNGERRLEVRGEGFEFRLEETPGNHRLVLSSAAYVRASLRNHGIGGLLCSWREDIVRQGLHYRRRLDPNSCEEVFLWAFVNEENAVQKHILVKRGWVQSGKIGTSQIWSKYIV